MSSRTRRRPPISCGRPTLKVEDVTDTLELALEASSIETACVVHRPRLLYDNGSSWQTSPNGSTTKDAASPRRSVSSDDTGQDRAMASDAQETASARIAICVASSRPRSATRLSRVPWSPASGAHRQAHRQRCRMSDLKLSLLGWDEYRQADVDAASPRSIQWDREVIACLVSSRPCWATKVSGPGSRDMCDIEP